MADRSIRLILTANVQGLVSGLKTASQATKDYGNRLSDFTSRNEQNISHLSNVLGGMGLALTAGFGYAVKTFADFDAAMSSVAAATMTTGAELEALRQAAIDAGAATSFSATEAAGAIENLAKAGISTTDILNGGLTGALDLAAAGELDVADAAEIAATAMTQFGLSGEDVTHIADLLAAGAGKAQGDVTDLAGALKQSGLVASQFGLSIEETTGSLAAFASAGLLGSDAGTSLRTMLLRLGNPSKEAADEMARLGISAYDAQGNFVGMTDLAGQLERALAPLPQAQRDAAMATIFGSDAIRAANVLYQQGAEGIQGWITAVDDQGYAAEQAAMRLDNLKGDLEALSGSFESLILQSGSGANEWLRGLVQGAEDVVDAFGQIPAPILNLSTLLVGGGGLVALGVAGLGKLVVGVNNAKIAIEGLGMSMRTAKVTAGALGGAIGAAAIGLTVWAQNAAQARAAVEEWKGTLDGLGNTTDATLSRINDKLSQSRDVWYKFGEDQRSMIQIAEDYGVSVADVQQAILGQKDALERVRDALADYREQTTIGTSDAYMFNDASGRLLSTISSQREEIERATTETERKAAADAAAGVEQEELSASYEVTTGTVMDQTVALSDLISAQREAAGVVLSAREAESQFQAAIDGVSESVAQNSATLDLNTAEGRANDAALRGVADAAWGVVEADQKAGASQDVLRDKMARGRQAFIAAAVAAGMTEQAANDLANQYGLIPETITTNIYANTGSAMQNIENLKAAMAGIRDRTVQITTAFQETGIRPPAGFYVPNSSIPGRALGGPAQGPRTYTSAASINLFPTLEIAA